jgi:hypothetical protein
VFEVVWKWACTGVHSASEHAMFLPGPEETRARLFDHRVLAAVSLLLAAILTGLIAFIADHILWE